MRQSDGTRTEKRLSAARFSQIRPGADDLFRNNRFRETIGGLTTPTVARPARIRSSLLLKTASSLFRGRNPAAATHSYVL